jgi:type II secretory pathway pseudopilin PulG
VPARAELGAAARSPAGPATAALPRGREGFLLLEALIGLAIMGLVAIALLAATSAQVRTADKASVLLVASALAQDRMASVHLLDHEGLVNPPDSLLAGTFAPPFEDFTWTAEVAESDGEYDLFAVRVEVRGHGEAFPTETLLHRPAPVLAVAGDQGGRGGGGEGNGAGRGRGRGDQGPGVGPRGRGGAGFPGVGRGGAGRGRGGAGRGAPGGGRPGGVVPPGGAR